ncbi:hypothetical protein F3Y22_tig00110549pilonHSYRG00033 [Hibiscus syriacus]|uniref:WAT1-related protein n=1 Tax=Hibiscus syriacus TaxID=106335 RepID=A0A6A3A998_HIBSY|nr:hypothetical protein F3Y22_tig00110549pilonHSYRG00033 [Hibiscus syriacus]
MNCGQQWRTVTAMVAINFAMAITNVLIKKILDDGTSHVIVLLYRQAISAVFVAPIAYFLERKSRPKLGARYTLSQYLFLMGLEYTSATYSCAFLNMVPAITFVLALPFGNFLDTNLEKVNLRNKSGIAKVVGTLVCIGGAMVLTLYKGEKLAGSDSGAAVHAVNSATTMVSTKNKKEMGCRFDISGCGYHLLVIMVPSASQNRTVISMPIFEHRDFFFLQCDSICHHKSDNREGLHQMDLERKTGTHNGCICGGGGISLVLCGMSCVQLKGPVFTSAFTPLVQIFVAYSISPFCMDKLLGRFVSYDNLVISTCYRIRFSRNRIVSALGQKLKCYRIRLVVIGLYSALGQKLRG